MTNDLSPGRVIAREINSHIRRAVFVLIEAQGLTRSQVQDALRDEHGEPMSRSALHTRLTGKTKFYAHELVQLAELLGVPLMAIILGDVEVRLAARGRVISWRAGDVRGEREVEAVVTSMVTDGVLLPSGGPTD